MPARVYSCGKACALLAHMLWNHIGMPDLKQAICM